MPLFHIFSGAEWIAQLGRCGLITPSYIPSAEITQLCLLTRRLHSYKQGQTQIKNEIHNLLQRATIQLTRLGKNSNWGENPVNLSMIKTHHIKVFEHLIWHVFLILRTFCPTSSKTGLALLNLCINGEVFTLDSISKCIHGHIKADPIQLLEAIDGKLSLKERFLLDQSLEDWWHYHNELIRDWN